MGPYGRRAALKVTVTISLAIISVMSLRSALQTRQATDELMGGTRKQEAVQQVMFVSLRFSGFLRDHQRLPRTLEELDPGISIVDPWGTALRYEILEPQPMWYRVGSAGPDRVFDTPDDIEQRVGGK
ncbi:MAG TPA: hypothetical protein VF950_18945 [Planctomycetota bacterium]